MDPTFVTIVAIVVLAFLVIASGIKIVPQSQTYVVERFGKYRTTLNAGLNLIVPFLDQVAHKIDILERRLPEHPSDVITKDNVLTNVTTSTFYRVRSPEYTVYRIKDIDGAIQTAVTGVVRSIIGVSEFDEVQSNRTQLNGKLRTELIEIADEWGIEITRCEIIDVNVDAATREAMQKQLNAERERRATVTKAEGDKRAVELNADAELYEAQKQAEAVRIQAEAEAYATETIAKAIAAGGLDAIKYEMLKRQVEAVGQVSASPNAKFIVLPSDLTDAFKDVGRMFQSRGGA